MPPRIATLGRMGRGGVKILPPFSIQKPFGRSYYLEWWRNEPTGQTLKVERQRQYKVYIGGWVMSVQRINEQIALLKDKGNVSDGHHTFCELYHHRMLLFSVICNTYEDKAWKSKLHDDGTMFDNYFIVGVTTPEGDFTYHYHLDHWGEFKVKELERAPEWDGHKAKDITRLLSLIRRCSPRTADIN